MTRANHSGLSSTGSVSSPSRRWAEEELFFDGDEFFQCVCTELEKAKQTIELESYIFVNDELGRRVVETLCAAAGRGVAVRVLVDGIGSPAWEGQFATRLESAGVQYRVFHRLPFQWLRTKLSGRIARGSVSYRLHELNRRNHRKLIIIDRATAFVGSMNVSAVHLRSLNGDRAWRDTGLRVSGEDVAVLSEGFERAWKPFPKRFPPKKALWRFPSELVRLNSTRKLRRRNYRDLVRRLSEAKVRIWITTPYFVPSGPVLKTLAMAACRGVDVRLLVPEKSDVFFMPWVAAALLREICAEGAKVFEFRPSVLHAKTLLVDDWATVGSSNFNHRSLFHDLEVDVVLSESRNVELLAEQFLRDCEQSRPIPEVSSSLSAKLFHLLGRAILLFRYWL